MQKWLMKNRNRLTAITGILIVLAFAAKWLFKSETAESGLLLAASSAASRSPHPLGRP